MKTKTDKTESKHYYIVSMRTIGALADDYKCGAYITRIHRASSKEEAVGQLCAWLKNKLPHHSILARDINVNTFNYIQPNLE